MSTDVLKSYLEIKNALDQNKRNQNLILVTSTNVYDEEKGIETVPSIFREKSEMAFQP
jgi:hypothetical protein